MQIGLRSTLLMLGIILATVLLPACSPAAAPAAEQPVIRVAALRILDALPMYVAEKEGFYTAHGVKVEIIPVGSAPERDQLIAAGKADGMINEIVSVLFYNRDSVQVQSVRFARAATADVHLFSILASKESGITSVEQLKGAPIGISDGTVIAYLTDRMLQKEGFTPEDIKTVSVPSLTDRMTLITSGKLQAGVLPEPLTSLAVQQGAVVVLDDSKYPDLSHSVISFRKQVLDQNPDAVKGFLAAIEDAVKAINADPAKYQTLMADLKLVPPPLAGSFTVPTFVTAGVPSDAQFKDVLEWTKAKGLLDKDIAYTDCVTPAFLP